MKVYDIKVKRDAHTSTPVQVPEHEIAILQTIFGEENVTNRDGRSIALDGLAESDAAGEVDLEAADEFDRLARKYGGNEEGAFVEQVYGKKAARGLENVLGEPTKKAAKKGKE